MQNLKWMSVLACLVFAAGCEDDGASDNEDAAVAVDAGPPDQAARDAAADVAPGADTSPPTDDASVQDAAGSAADAAAEAGPLDPGPVQCRSDADCGGSLTCLMHIPGGHCKGCSTSVSCPAGLKCFQGICVRPCSTDADCNLGLRCLAAGHCAGKGCNAGTGCPEIYPCNFPLCERPKCDQGQVCPAPLTCDGTWCVEP